MRRLSATELREHLLEQNENRVLLDVRELWEYDICHLEGSMHLPMGQVPEAIHTLRPDDEIVVICHHGVRSLQVAMYLEHYGFCNIINLEGGIDAWARTVDPKMAMY